MRLLVLGGTRFLGRHLVDLALARGDDVTVFTRGKQPNHWQGRVTALVGNRDQAVSPGLRALETGAWDAVVDTCGYVPRIVRQSAELLAPRVGRYLFVSSISVFTDASRPGLTEKDPVGALDDPGTEEIGKFYGPLKAACERVVSEVYGYRALNVRPGLIVGPHDPTDRFGYWVARFVHPELLGDRASHAVVPNPPARPIQLIDARDLAAWMLDLAERREAGSFNATGPIGQTTMGELLGAAVDATASGAELVWRSDEQLRAVDAGPWMELPLWAPMDEMPGTWRIATARAQAAGLRCRPAPETVRDVWHWLREGGEAEVSDWGSHARPAPMSAAREAELLGG